MLQFLKDHSISIIGVVVGAVVVIVGIAMMDKHSSTKKKSGTSKDSPPGES